MTREQRLWKAVKPYVPGHAERVENVAFPGFPDVNGCWSGRDYWIELKAPRAKTYDLDKLLEVSQKVWHFNRVREGGIVFVLVKTSDGVLYLHQALYAKPARVKYLIVFRFEAPTAWSLFEETLKNIIKER